MDHLCRRLVVLAPTAILATSCNLYFQEPGGVDPTVRINLPFGAAEPTPFAGGDPSVSNDGLELWFVPTDTSTTDKYDIYHARRSSLNDNFSIGEPLNINSLANDVDAAISADRLLVTFASDRDKSNHAVYEARRDNASDAFMGVNGTNLVFDTFRGIDASPDGLSVLYPDGNGIKVFQRKTRKETYKAAPDIALTDPNVAYPTFSFDRKELVYSTPNGASLLRAMLSADGTRYEAPQPFSVGVTCNSSLFDADFSDDAMAITFNCDGKVYISYRTP